MAEKIKISVEDHSPLTEQVHSDMTQDSNVETNSCSGETLSVDGGQFTLHKCRSFPRIQGNNSLTASRTTLCTLETISPRVSTENINDEYSTFSEGAGLLVRSFSDKSMDSLPPLDNSFRSGGSGGLITSRNGKQASYHRSTSCPSMHKTEGGISPTRSPGAPRLGHMSRKEAMVNGHSEGKRAECKEGGVSSEAEKPLEDTNKNKQNIDSSFKRCTISTKKRPLSHGSAKFVNIRDLNTDFARQVISGFESNSSSAKAKAEQESRQRCEQWLNTIDHNSEEHIEDPIDL